MRDVGASSEVLNVAVVGCGYWGPNLIRNFASLPQCRVSHVCDINHERLSRMHEQYPKARATSRFEDIMSDSTVDAVVVATPPETHFPLAKSALLAGKHVFVEKPLALSSGHCRELMQLAADMRRVLMPGHTYVYHPAVIKIKEIIDSGLLGELLHVRSQRLSFGLFQTGVDVAWDLAPHDLSIILYLLGRNPTGVSSQGFGHLVDQRDDTVSMMLHFEESLSVHLHCSWLSPVKTRQMVFIGTRAMLLFDDIEAESKLRVYEKRVECSPITGLNGRLEFAYSSDGEYVLETAVGEPLLAECTRFADCILAGAKRTSNAADALQVIQILEASAGSRAQGGMRVAPVFDEVAVL